MAFRALSWVIAKSDVQWMVQGFGMVSKSFPLTRSSQRYSTSLTSNLCLRLVIQMPGEGFHSQLLHEERNAPPPCCDNGPLAVKVEKLNVFPSANQHSDGYGSADHRSSHGLGMYRSVLLKYLKHDISHLGDQRKFPVHIFRRQVVNDLLKHFGAYRQPLDLCLCVHRSAS